MKEKDGKKDHQWFVEPKSQFANEVIGKMLAESADVYDSSVAMTDDQEISHSVYQVPGYDFITKLRRSQLSSPRDYMVFCRVGSHGPIRVWTLLNKRTKKKDEATQ